MGVALKRIESKTGPTETNSLGAPALRGFAKSLKPNQLCFPRNWKPFKPLIFSQRLLLTFVLLIEKVFLSHIYLRWPKAGYTTDETQHKSHKQIFIFRLTFFLILKLFECHCCNFRHTKTKTLPFPLGRRLRVMATVRRLTKCFCFKCFLQLLLCERGGERFIERAACALLFPAICKWPNHEYKMLTKYKHNQCKYTNTQKTETQMKWCSCKYKAIMEGFFFVQFEI